MKPKQWMRQLLLPVLPVFIWGIQGCTESDSTACVETPDEMIEGFELEITTGYSGTNCDIDFCVKRRSSPQWECVLLNYVLVDDFEAEQTGYYDVYFDPIAPGDLERFEFLNTNCPLWSDAWAIDEIFIDALLEDGSLVTVYGAQYDSPVPEVEEGEAFELPSCDSLS